MVKHNIDLANFLTEGQVSCEYRDNMLYMTTKRTIPTQRFDLEHLSISGFADVRVFVNEINSILQETV